ncbi:MAG TPA: AMP-binding protein [Candidatus Angelobacter sp.]|nr:AMP-binding protein [Candidatus Angelobacter sp.]
MTPKLSERTSFVDLLRERAALQGDQKACVFLLEGHIQQSTATFAELDRKARAIAALLQELGCRGERALLFYPTGIDYIQAFFACLYSNTIAVPAYPPRVNRKLERLQFLIEDAQPKFILTTSSILSGLQKMADKLPLLKNIRWINTDDFDVQRAAGWKEEQIDADTIAFLQYTSGSIATPKGVMVSHGNLLYNQLVMREAMGHDKDTTVVSWLPLYHDMGLIGNLLAGIFNGVPCYLISPADFIQNPINWLRAISTYRCTFSGGPNFAYDLCLRKAALPEYLSELDLSCWKIAFNGSEPVRAHTITRFQETFASCGFRPEAMYPCYGLAEATLFVSGRNRASVPVMSMTSFNKDALAKQRAVITTNHNGAARQLVSCGSAWLEDTINIVDPEAMTKCEDGQMGEVWFKSPAVAKGYWNNPKQTADVFHAHLAGNADGPFLRTGDLGVVHNDEIYIGGRLKDVIIIGGSNHYPHDIEQTIEGCHRAIRQGCTAAFAVDQDSEERLAFVAEVVRGQNTDLQMSEIFETVRRAIAREHEVDVYAGALVPPLMILKTSSGKIQRQATREAFEKNDLPVIYRWQRRDEISAERRQSPTGLLETIKAWLLVELSSGLKITLAQLRPDAPIATYGVSSLIAADIASKISDRFSIPFPADKLFIGEPTVNQIAFLVDRCYGETRNAESHC